MSTPTKFAITQNGNRVIRPMTVKLGSEDVLVFVDGACVPAEFQRRAFSRLREMGYVIAEAPAPKLKLTTAAQLNVEETGADPQADVQAIRSGAYTAETLLAHCLNAADEDRVQGWRDYVDAVVAADARCEAWVAGESDDGPDAAAVQS